MISTKAKTLFVEMDNLATHIAVTSNLNGTTQVEELATISATTDAGKDKVRKIILSHAQGKSARHVPCHTSVYPLSRFFIRHTLDNTAKIKDQGFVEELVSQKMGIDLNANAVSVVSATDGTPFDPEKGLASQKELLACGALVSELRALQNTLLEQGIYPSHMELGTLSTIGGLMDYARHQSIRQPILYLEVGLKNTHLQILSAEKVDLGRAIALGLDSAIPALSEQLGVKDEESARNILYSNTFDLTEMGTSLLNRLLREIRASTAFYEVQTGQSIGAMFISIPIQGMDWIGRSIERDLGIGRLIPDMTSWLNARGVSLSENLAPEAKKEGNLGIFSLMITHPVPAQA